MSTLYEQLGGAAAVDAAVDKFYRRVLADDRISRFFANVDMDKQAIKQKAFLTMAFGGPNNYTFKDMKEGHAHLLAMGMDDTHFDAVVEDLGATLKDMGVSDDLIQQVADVAGTPYPNASTTAPFPSPAMPTSLATVTTASSSRPTATSPACGHCATGTAS